MDGKQMENNGGMKTGTLFAEKKRWTAWDCRQMRMKCRQYLMMDGMEIMENTEWVLLLNCPPLSIPRLVEKMEIKYPEYKNTDMTLQELIISKYGEKALDFILEYAGLK